MSNKNKNKGSNAERYYAKKFRDLGFDKCVTARYGSRLHDDAGIDLINLPLNVQIKAGKQRGLNPSSVLEYTKEQARLLFPSNDPVQGKPTILIHKKDVGRGFEKTEYHEIVSMTFEDFSKLIDKIKKWD